MTTLVWCDGVLAADSRCTRNDAVAAGSWPKIGHLPDGRIYGYCGSSAEARRVVRALERGESPPDVSSATVIIASASGVLVIEDGESMELPADALFGAWGSGGPAALGALHVGASAVAAVEAACQVDIYSGLPVQSLQCGRTENGDARRKNNRSLLKVRPARNANRAVRV